MQNFFTFSRVDRHEITFRVEQNPEKKTATDVARAINDSRFKNNLSRRYGVVVVRAGVGDKVNHFPYNNKCLFFLLISNCFVKCITASVFPLHLLWKLW